MIPDRLAALAPPLHAIVQEAGAMALRFFRPGQTCSAEIWSKAGGSPVTEADLAVDTFLKARLSGLLPEAGWLSEETADDPARLGRRMTWIVDPIDGTRAFLSGHPDWSVSVALLVDGEPALAALDAPAHRVLYAARAGGGATCEGTPLKVSPRTGLPGARVAGPKPLIDHLSRRVGPVEAVPRVPSLALRIARVGEGSIECGLVSGNARDWDIAAADLILREAGGRLTAPDGVAPRYNQAEPIHGELLAASEALHLPLVEAMRTAARR